MTRSPGWCYPYFGKELQDKTNITNRCLFSRCCLYLPFYSRALTEDVVIIRLEVDDCRYLIFLTRIADTPAWSSVYKDRREPLLVRRQRGPASGHLFGHPPRIRRLPGQGRVAQRATRICGVTRGRGLQRTKELVPLEGPPYILFKERHPGCPSSGATAALFNKNARGGRRTTITKEHRAHRNGEKVEERFSL